MEEPTINPFSFGPGQPTVGRIVHFVLKDDELPPPPSPFVKNTKGQPVPKPNFVPRWNRGDHCAAIVVGSTFNEPGRLGCVNLHVFHNAPMFAFWNDVPYSEGKEPGTWHWPERV